MLAKDAEGLSLAEFLWGMRPYFILLANAYLVDVGPHVQPPEFYDSIVVRFRC